MLGPVSLPHWVPCWDSRGWEAGKKKPYPLEVVFLDPPGPDRQWFAFLYELFEMYDKGFVICLGGTKPGSPLSHPSCGPGGPTSSQDL